MKRSTTDFRTSVTDFRRKSFNTRFGSIIAFNLSHRDIEDLLAERGITVSYESIRLWCNKFGLKYVRRLKKKHQGYGDTFFIDEVFVKIDGKQHYLWRAVDQDGEIVDVFLQRRRDGKAAGTEKDSDG